MKCDKVKELLYYYFYHELNPALEECISMHLEDCQQCSQYYDNLIKEINENKNIEILSAYIDNELTDKENIQLKKNIISNKNLRKQYDKLSSLSRLLKNSLSRQEYLVKDDYTKLIFRKLNLTDAVYGRSPYPQVAGVFVVIFVGLFLAILAIFGI